MAYSVDLKNLSKKQLVRELGLAREWLNESQGSGFTPKQKDNLGKVHRETIGKILGELNQR
jgi:hypothetical protein